MTEEKTPKVAIIYWSGTGNTEAMAITISLGAGEAGADTVLARVENSQELASLGTLDGFDAFAFGCPACGKENLAKSFEPIWDECMRRLNGRKTAIFGSYGRGNGLWMRRWQELCEANDVNLVLPCVICKDEPNDEIYTVCRYIGGELAKGGE